MDKKPPNFRLGLCCMNCKHLGMRGSPFCRKYDALVELDGVCDGFENLEKDKPDGG